MPPPPPAPPPRPPAGAESSSTDLERRLGGTKSSFPSSPSSASSSASSSATPEAPPVAFLDLFRFTTRREKGLMLISSVAALFHGALPSFSNIIFGAIVETFTDPSVSKAEIVAEVGGVAKWFLILGAASFVASFIQVKFLVAVASATSIRIRKLYFHSLMRQDFEWYDGESSGELTARVASDVDLIQAGIGDKIGVALQSSSTAVVGMIIAFVYTWKLSLVILSVTPLLAICGGVFAKLMANSTGDGQDAYGEAGGIASEVLSLIKTVHAFGGQEEEAKRYEVKLGAAYKSNVRKGFVNGAGLGLAMFCIFGCYALSFWYGAKLVRDGEIGVQDVFVAFFSVIMGSMSIGQAAPAFAAFATARGAAPRVYSVIERQSRIDPLAEDGGGGVIPSGELESSMCFKDVVFNYKSRADEGGEPVLRGLNLNVAAGTTHALVGRSGCGKSSTMALMERFYNPQEGSIEIGGVAICNVNVSWLRSQMGYVGQMPTLFRASIRDNIAYGAAVRFADGVMTRDDVTEEQIIAASKLANCHDFIVKLPEGYDTLLGDRGALLSGGQKQRVCIARAVVRDPKFLLLDEATSALDAHSEHVVQEALERAAEGRTTVVIAHRLSTVRNADVISVLKDGVVVESGSYDDLLSRPEGIFRDLVEMQLVAAQKSKESTLYGEDEVDSGVVAKKFPAEKSLNTSTAVDSIDGGLVSKDGKIGSESGSEDSTPDVDAGVVSRAFRLNKAEWLYMLFGCIGATMAGASWPLSALAFSEVTVLLGAPDKKDEVVFWAICFVAIGVASLIGNTLQIGMLGISGERLTRKIRAQTFRAVLKQDLAFFDEEEHSVGSLTTRLATEASYVKGLCGESMGMAVVTISTIGVGLGVSFGGCWRLALVVLALVPVMALSGYTQLRVLTGFDGKSKKDFVRAGSYASEAVDNIRTVTSLGIQDKFIDRYGEALEVPEKNGKKGSYVSGVSFGFSEFFMFVVWALSFWVGSIFIENGSCSFLGVMKAIQGLLFAGISLGNVSMFAPDIGKAKVAATNIFRLLDRQSLIDPSTGEGRYLQSAAGNIDITGAKFEYPCRPDVAVLRGLNMSVAPGKTLALVGGSGSGKSTVVHLLERFYDVRSGSVDMDGNDIRELNVQSVRSHMALVQQEPDLFNRTIKANIAYGLAKDGATPVSDDVIRRAAEAANCANFIGELPQGYDTPVGERGGSMSGGMKQRVAIARALVREPRFLLLDEATSALDVQSEKVVQDALDAARQGRTTVVVAHRLSTVKDADSIAVLSRGKIVEIGTHNELMDKNGAYSKLVRHQTTEVGHS